LQTRIERFYSQTIPLYEIDFLRPIKPGAEVFFIPRIEGG
jgi:hypothetical protein